MRQAAEAVDFAMCRLQLTAFRSTAFSTCSPLSADESFLPLHRRHSITALLSHTSLSRYGKHCFFRGLWYGRQATLRVHC